MYVHIRRMPILSRISVFAVALAVAACGGSQPADQAAIAACKSRSSAAVGGPFSLTAHNGAPTTEANFKGRKALVFFGYTYCPDICPVVLFNVGKALEDVPEAKRPVTVFISVDPARDTPETIAQYIRSNGFPEDIIGLTGTLDELKAVNAAFKTPGFGREDDTDASGGYLVSHSSWLYLMNEDWTMDTFFNDTASPAEIARCINLLS